ncbi:hypothetical protein D9613_004046 [Agrocybe pediades]|uniref:Uncharacterized protein n=1 Tax=Agrocybe pediades TaxID=84607 RepID=A0A8H4QIF3_9AGAR|nr:hypothetical protein D9613_004046 [Agrocybe pediades]
MMEMAHIEKLLCLDCADPLTGLELMDDESLVITCVYAVTCLFGQRSRRVQPESLSLATIVIMSRLVQVLDKATAKPAANLFRDSALVHPAHNIPVNPESSTIKNALARRALAREKEDENQVDKWRADFKEASKWLEAPTTTAHRDRIKTHFLLFIQEVAKLEELPTVDYAFSLENVRKYAEVFLPWELSIMIPKKKNNDTVKAVSLLSNMALLVDCIVKFCEDENGEKMGFTLLAKGGLWRALKAQVTHLVHTHHLGRSRDPKLYLGRPGLWVIINDMLQETENKGPQRQVAIQGATKMLLALVTSQRGSSNGVPRENLRELGYAIRHIRVVRLGYAKYVIYLTQDEFKGSFAQATTDLQHSALTGVLYAHNAILDPTLFFAAHCISRKLFKVKYEDVPAFLADTRAEIPFDPSKLDEPLFGKCLQGGNGFVQPIIASTSESASDLVAYHCQKSGMERRGYTAIRHDTGNLMAHVIGIEGTQAMMNHQSTIAPMFHNHYSRTLENYNLTSLRLGEMAGPLEKKPGEAMERIEAMTLFKDSVVDCLLRRKNVDRKEENKNLNATIREDTSKTENVVELTGRINAVYDDFLTCFSRGFVEKDKLLINANRLYKNALKKQAANTGKKVKGSFIPGLEKKAEELLGQLKIMFAQKTKLNRVTSTRLKRTHLWEQTNKIPDEVLLGSSEERQEIINNLKNHSVPLLKKAVAAHQGTACSTFFAILHLTFAYALELTNADAEKGLDHSMTRVRHALETAVLEDLEAEEQETQEAEGLLGFGASLNGFDESDSFQKFQREIVEAVENGDEEPYEESREVDVFAMDITLIWVSLLEYLLKPIFDLDKRKATMVPMVYVPPAVQADDDVEEASGSSVQSAGASIKATKLGIQCDLCDRAPLPSWSKLTRHKEQVHTDWVNLRTAIEANSTDNKHFECPEKDFVAETPGEVINHCVSYGCSSQAKYLSFQREHQAFRYKNTTGKVAGPRAKAQAAVDLDGLDVTTVDFENHKAVRPFSSFINAAPSRLIMPEPTNHNLDEPLDWNFLMEKLQIGFDATESGRVCVDKMNKGLELFSKTKGGSE